MAEADVNATGLYAGPQKKTASGVDETREAVCEWNRNRKELEGRLRGLFVVA